MSDIPVVNEIGDRFEVAIRASAMPARPKGALVATVAFAITAVVVGLGGLFAVVGYLGQERASHAQDHILTQGDVGTALAVTEVAELVPAPPGMTSDNGSESAIVEDLSGGTVATLTFSTVSGAGAESVTVLVSDLAADSQDPSAVMVEVAGAEAILVASDFLVSVSWNSAAGPRIQVVARSPVTPEWVLAYAEALERAASAALKASIGE